MDFLLMQGRMGRSRFLMVSLLPVSVVCALVAATLICSAYGVKSGLLSPGPLDLTVMALAGLFLTWVVVAAHVSRLHDIGQTGLWALLGFIPGVSVVLWVFLLFAAGEKTTNRYGERPR